MKQLGSIPNPPYIWPHHRCGHFSYIFTLYNTLRHRASRLLCRQKIPAEVQTAGIHFKITGAAALSFDRSRCQTGDELTVRKQVYDQNRDQGDGSAGRHNVPFCRGVGRITQICHSHAQCFHCLLYTSPAAAPTPRAWFPGSAEYRTTGHTPNSGTC